MWKVWLPVAAAAMKTAAMETATMEAAAMETAAMKTSPEAGPSAEGKAPGIAAMVKAAEGTGVRPHLAVRLSEPTSKSMIGLKVPVS
jgi:hypothetical protein